MADDTRKTLAELREMNLLCDVVCTDGYTCRGYRKYGRLCGLHYSIAEVNISKITRVKAA